MPNQLEVVKTDTDLKNKLERFRDLTDNNITAVLCELGGGVLRFADAAFPRFDRTELLAQTFTREPEGRGAHFDVYGQYINDAFPWLALYNLSGRVSIRAVQLPADLAKAYFDRYPEASDEALDARRQFSALALRSPGAEIHAGHLAPNTGMVLPQREEWPHIVHEITPLDAGSPGEYIKMVAPINNPRRRKELEQRGYVSFDELITQTFSSDRTHAQSLRAAAETFLPSRRPARSRRNEPRHPCNLD